MRTDYEYVDQATSMCMYTTRLGDARLESLLQPGVQVPKDAITEIMLTIQDEYILVEDGGITLWVGAIEKYRKENHLQEIPALDLQAALVYAFGMDWIGIHKVVWD